MADIQVIKLKVRRGLNSQRRLVVLDEGELGFTTDTQRLFVGTGIISGGLPAAPKIHNPLTNFNDVSAINPENGDLVYADNKLYQYTLTSWTFVGPQVDEGFISYDEDNQLTVSLSSIDGTRLHQQALSSTSIKFNSNQLVVNYNTSQFTISGDTFAIAASGIKPIHIDSSVVSKGLVGGAGNPLSAAVDGTTIGFNGSNQLTVISQPVSTVTYNKLSGGFNVNPTNNSVSTIVQGVDSNNFALCAGIVTLNQGFSSLQELPYFDVDNAGIIKLTQSSIYEILSCDVTGPLSTFNGAPNQVLSGYTPSNGITTIQVIPDVSGPLAGVTTLSSAGFIVFNNGGTARGNSNNTFGRFAIPIFTY